MSKKSHTTTACTNTTNCSNTTNLVDTTNCSNTVDSSAMDCGNCGSGCGCKGKKK